MKVFTEFYESKIEELRTKHLKWVESNGKMNALYLALEQVKSEGDIIVDSVIEDLKKIQSKEKRYNDKLCEEVHYLKCFIRDMEIEARKNGIEWNKTIEIFGY